LVRSVSSTLVPKCPRHFGTGPFTSATTQKFETLRHQTHGAEMSWVRSVLGPKCPYTPDVARTRTHSSYRDNAWSTANQRLVILKSIHQYVL